MVGGIRNRQNRIAAAITDSRKASSYSTEVRLGILANASVSLAPAVGPMRLLAKLSTGVNIIVLSRFSGFKMDSGCYHCFEKSELLLDRSQTGHIGKRLSELGSSLSVDVVVAQAEWKSKGAVRMFGGFS